MADFITSNILRNPPILLGLIAMIGLISQGKKIEDVIKGTVMTAFGMIILNEGVGMLVNSILPISNAFGAITGGAVGEGLNDVTFTSTFGGDVGMAMFIALVLHLLIARFTKFKTIFLTGHMLWWFPFIFVAAGAEAGLSGMLLIGISALCSALYFSIMPWIMRKYVWAVTEDESFLIGHPTGFLSIIAGFVSSKVGNKKKSTEDLNVPKSLSFLREVSITGSLVLLLVYIVVTIIVPSLADGQNAIMQAMNQGLNFGAGLLVLLYGVRMLISQIVPAFKGISEKLVPDAKPAFDCPVLFNYKPNAVIIGFITAMIVSTVVIVICNVTGVFSTLLLPLVITCFFECGAAAVIAEGQGGLRGTIIGTSVAAIAMVLVLGLSVTIYQTTISNWMLIFGGNDFSLFGPIVYYIMHIFG